jgi:hypothetical protein
MLHGTLRKYQSSEKIRRGTLLLPRYVKWLEQFRTSPMFLKSHLSPRIGKKILYLTKSL